MKKTLSIIGIIVVVCAMFTACQGRFANLDILSIPEQEAVEYEEDAKIYPSQVGSYLTDKKVDSPVISAFMEKYNAAATSKTRIDYDAIRYNADSGYYYVNDTGTSRGIKFALDSAATTIVSASVYSGDISTASGNLVDMMNIVASNLGYKNSISSTDAGAITSVLSTYNSDKGNIQSALPTFQNGMQLTMNLDNLFVELALPDMPLSYTPDATNKAQGDANAYVTSPSIEDPTKSAEQNTEPYTFTIGDDFKNNYAPNVTEHLEGFKPTTTEPSSEESTVSSANTNPNSIIPN